MKTQILIAAAVFTATFTINAQNTTAPTDKPDKAAGAWKGRDKYLEGMPEEMRSRFQEAREAVMQDPELQALKNKADEASKVFRDAMREAMMQRDPELAKQVRTYFEERRKTDGDRPKPRAERQPENSKPPIPPEQRDRLEKAREIAKQAPAVQSAEAKLKAATSPEERHQASKEFHEAMRNAMLTADPSLAEVLDKIRPPRNQEHKLKEPKTSAE